MPNSFRDPEFVMFVGPMFSSKTSKLLSAIDRCRYQNKKITAFKPGMDGRYSQSNIVTHAGHSWPATNVSNGQEILDLSRASDIIAVDEAFMIDGSAQALIELFKQGKTVYVSSIQLSASGHAFEEVKEMMPWATKIEVCPSVCPVTQRDAYYTIRKVDGLEEISVGGSEHYEPRCWEMTPFMKE
jgi:thymidine kinase